MTLRPIRAPRAPAPPKTLIEYDLVGGVPQFDELELNALTTVPNYDVPGCPDRHGAPPPSDFTVTIDSFFDDSAYDASYLAQRQLWLARTDGSKALVGKNLRVLPLGGMLIIPT